MWYSKRLNFFSLLPTYSRTKRHPMIIFPDLANIEVEGVEVAEEIILTLRTISLTASCPSCGTASSRIQSRYTRMLHDIPRWPTTGSNKSYFPPFQVLFVLPLPSRWCV